MRKGGKVRNIVCEQAPEGKREKKNPGGKNRGRGEKWDGKNALFLQLLPEKINRETSIGGIGAFN